MRARRLYFFKNGNDDRPCLAIDGGGVSYCHEVAYKAFKKYTGQPVHPKHINHCFWERHFSQSQVDLIRTCNCNPIFSGPPPYGRSTVFTFQFLPEKHSTVHPINGFITITFKYPITSLKRGVIITSIVYSCIHI